MKPHDFIAYDSEKYPEGLGDFTPTMLFGEGAADHLELESRVQIYIARALGQSGENRSAWVHYLFYTAVASRLSAEALNEGADNGTYFRNRSFSQIKYFQDLAERAFKEYHNSLITARKIEGSKSIRRVTSF